MLDFGFLPQDDTLEAKVPGGYYHIYYSHNMFRVSAYVAHELFTLGGFSTIYEALDAANNHYNGEPIRDSQDH